MNRRKNEGLQSPGRRGTMPARSRIQHTLYHEAPVPKGKVAPAVAFVKLRRTLVRISGAFVSKYGGRYDDVVADSFGHFVEVYEDYDGRMPLVRYVVVRVWNRLLDQARKEARLNRILPRVPHHLFDPDVPGASDEPISAPEPEPAPDPFSLDEFVDRTPKPTRADVRAAVVALFSGRLIRLSSAKLARDGLVEKLRRSQWSVERIRNTFNSIRKALT